MSLRRYKWRVCGCGQTTSKWFIHKAPSYNLRNYSGNLEKTSNMWNFGGWKINVCKMKELIVLPIVWEHLCGLKRFPVHTNALTQLIKFHFISRLVIKRGLELMASTLASTFHKEEVAVWTPPFPCWHHLLLVWICFIQDLWVDGSGDFTQHEVFFFKLYPRGKETITWDNIGTSRSIRS